MQTSGKPGATIAYQPDALGADALRAVVDATGYRMLDAACFLP